MSEVESYKGKLVPVEMNGLSLEEKCKELCSATELDSYVQSWFEQLKEEKYDSYYYSKQLDTLFAVEKTELDPEGFLEMTKNEDGSYEFMTSFYNGGASIAEVLDSGIKHTEP